MIHRPTRVRLAAQQLVLARWLHMVGQHRTLFRALPREVLKVALQHQQEAFRAIRYGDRMWRLKQARCWEEGGLHLST